MNLKLLTLDSGLKNDAKNWVNGNPKQHLAAFLNQCALCDRFYNNDPEKMMAERNK